MIKNSKQAATAKINLRKLQEDRQKFIDNQTDLNDLVLKLTIDSFDGLIEDLTEEIYNYEQLTSQAFNCLKNKSFEDLAEIFISSRLAQGISQKELANAIGIQEQQIQRYEQTDYEGASLPRLQEVADALNISLIFENISILGKQPNFLLPSNISDDDVEIAESKIKETCSLVFS